METLKAGWTFVRENDARTILSQFNGKETHPFLQFVKYGFCGVPRRGRAQCCIRSSLALDQPGY